MADLSFVLPITAVGYALNVAAGAMLLVPAPLLAGLIGSRWSAVRERRAGDGTLPGKEPCRQAAEGLLQQTNI